MPSPDLPTCTWCGIAGGGHSVGCQSSDAKPDYPHTVKTNYSKAANSIEWDEAVVQQVTAYLKKKGDHLKPGDVIGPVGKKTSPKKPTDLPDPDEHYPAIKNYYPGGVVTGPIKLQSGTKVTGDSSGGITISGPQGSLTYPGNTNPSPTYLPPSGQHDPLPVTKYIGMDLNTPPAKHLQGLKPGQVVTQTYNGIWKPVGDLTGAQAMQAYQQAHPEQKVGQIVSHDWASQYVKIQTSPYVPENTLMAIALNTTPSYATFTSSPPPPLQAANFPINTYCTATFTWTTPDGTTHTMEAPKVMLGQIFAENMNSGWTDSLKMDLTVLHPNGSGPMLTFGISNPEQLQAEQDPITALARDLFDTETKNASWAAEPPEVKKAYCKRVGDFLDGKTENP